MMLLKNNATKTPPACLNIWEVRLINGDLEHAIMKNKVKKQ